MLMLSLVLLIAACAYSSNRKEIDRSTVKNVNLKDFMGKWYEIARFDHRFERGMTDITATYTLLDNGKIKVVNRGMRNGKPTEAIGKAKTSDIPGQLRVSFFWEFYSDYNILAMGKSGEWALIGSNSPKYLWILSRTPHLSSSTLEYIIRLAQARGYDTDKLIIDND
jgi:lipocalin